LYRKQLVFLHAPVYDTDRIKVPPLEGFVMNRVLGDYLETLLYKIFVSIDEHTTVAELAEILRIDKQQVRGARGACRCSRSPSVIFALLPSTPHGLAFLAFLVGERRRLHLSSARLCF
jgi:hypothetical protein